MVIIISSSVLSKKLPECKIQLWLLSCLRPTVVISNVCNLEQVVMMLCYLFVSRDIELGDLVVVGQCRPLSKTVRFNVLKMQKVKGGKKQFQKF